MKKYMSVIFIMLFILVPNHVFAKNIAIYVDSIPLSMDVPPVIVQGRTLVPISIIGRSLNANVVWNEKNRSISISKGNSIIRLSLDSKVAYVNDKMVLLEVPAQSVRGRTMVPLSFISAAFNETVRWDASGLAILIDSESPVRTLERDENTEEQDKAIPQGLSKSEINPESYEILNAPTEHGNKPKDSIEVTDFIEVTDSVETNQDSEKAPLN